MWPWRTFITGRDRSSTPIRFSSARVVVRNVAAREQNTIGVTRTSAAAPSISVGSGGPRYWPPPPIYFFIIIIFIIIIIFYFQVLLSSPISTCHLHMNRR